MVWPSGANLAFQIVPRLKVKRWYEGGGVFQIGLPTKMPAASAPAVSSAAANHINRSRRNTGDLPVLSDTAGKAAAVSKREPDCVVSVPSAKPRSLAD